MGDDVRFAVGVESTNFEPDPDLRLLTETMIQSPINAYFPDLFNILIHLTVFAPELSATFKIL